jgi:hypothetical protein
MTISAMFSEWLLADGLVEPLRVGQTVSAEFELEKPEGIRRGDQAYFQLRDAECRFSGDIVSKYVARNKTHGVVVTTGSFSFFVDSDEVRMFEIGDMICGQGVLSFDWRRKLSAFGVEGFDQPDISRIIRITRIRRAHASDFVSVDANGVFRRRASIAPRFVDVANMEEHTGSGGVLVVDAETIE